MAKLQTLPLTLGGIPCHHRSRTFREHHLDRTELHSLFSHPFHNPWHQGQGGMPCPQPAWRVHPCWALLAQVQEGPWGAQTDRDTHRCTWSYELPENRDRG